MKLYEYFGIIGLTSILLWVAALVLLLWAWRRPQRHLLFYWAFALAIAGVILARINSASIGDIGVDRTEEVEAAHRAYAAERGAARISFAEDSGTDKLDMAGMKRDERTAVEAEASPEAAAAAAAAGEEPAYKRGAKVKREAGKKDVLIKEGQAELKPEKPPRQMKEPDVIMANRLDRYNLLCTNGVFYLLLLLILWDYFKNFNTTTATYFPMPIGGRLLDTLFPKTHSVLVEKPENAALAHYVETVVRKGESYIYFGPTDLWPYDWALPKLVVAKRPFFPFAKISPGDGALPPAAPFFWDSAWFGRYGVVVTASGEIPALLDSLIDYLRLRQRTQAMTRRTVHLIWNHGVLDDTILKELIRLCTDANIKLVYAAPTLPATAVLDTFSEVFCDQAPVAVTEAPAEVSAVEGLKLGSVQVRHRGTEKQVTPYLRYAVLLVGLVLCSGLVIVGMAWWSNRVETKKQLALAEAAYKAELLAAVPATKPGQKPTKPGTTAAVPPGGKPAAAGTPPKAGGSATVAATAPAPRPAPVAEPGETAPPPEPAPGAVEDPNDPLTAALLEVRSLRDAGQFKQALDKIQEINTKFPGNGKTDELRGIEGRLKEALRDAPQLQVALDKLASSDENIVVVASGQLMETGEIGSILLRKTVREGAEAAAGAAAGVLAKQLDAKAVPALIARMKTASPDLSLKLVKALLPLLESIKGPSLKELCLLTQNDPKFKQRMAVRLLGQVIKKIFSGDAVEFNKSAGLPDAAEKLLWYVEDAAASLDKDIQQWGKETLDSFRKIVLVPGIAGKYYIGENFDQLSFERLDASMNFDTDKAFDLPKGRRTYFSVRWTGVLKIKTPGTYKFLIKSDDGCRLSVAERSLVDRWGAKVEKPASLEIAKAGYFAIQVDYQQIDKMGFISLIWEGPDFKPRPITRDDLRATPVRPGVQPVDSILK